MQQPLRNSLCVVFACILTLVSCAASEPSSPSSNITEEQHTLRSALRQLLLSDKGAANIAPSLKTTTQFEFATDLSDRENSWGKILKYSIPAILAGILLPLVSARWIYPNIPWAPAKTRLEGEQRAFIDYQGGFHYNFLKSLVTREHRYTTDTSNWDTLTFSPEDRAKLADAVPAAVAKHTKRLKQQEMLSTPISSAVTSLTAVLLACYLGRKKEASRRIREVQNAIDDFADTDTPETRAQLKKAYTPYMARKRVVDALLTAGLSAQIALLISTFAGHAERERKLNLVIGATHSSENEALEATRESAQNPYMFKFRVRRLQECLSRYPSTNRATACIARTILMNDQAREAFRKMQAREALNGAERQSVDSVVETLNTLANHNNADELWETLRHTNAPLSDLLLLSDSRRSTIEDIIRLATGASREEALTPEQRQGALYAVVKKLVFDYLDLPQCWKSKAAWAEEFRKRKIDTIVKGVEAARDLAANTRSSNSRGVPLTPFSLEA